MIKSTTQMINTMLPGANTRKRTHERESESVATTQLTAACSMNKSEQPPVPPIETVLPPPSLLSRYSCASIVVAIFAAFGKFAFVDEADVPGGGRVELHSWKSPLCATIFYLVSLPILTKLTRKFLKNSVDVKLLLRESMILYNAGQVLLNAWTVYKILYAIIYKNHPFIGGPIHLVDTGATYAVWVHYCDKYLEFLDTYFMVLRGKMDQVSAVVSTHSCDCEAFLGAIR